MESDTSHRSKFETNSSKIEVFHLLPSLEYITCPICLEFPHNGVLLMCTSYEKGCRPFMCDTDHTQSNCLHRFKNAFGASEIGTDPSTSDAESAEIIDPIELEEKQCLACPLCRGKVTEWVVLDNVRLYLNKKSRFCEQEKCTFKGNYSELQDHSKLEHSHVQPSKIDSNRQLDWDNFQESSEIVDVLSSINSEVPHGVVVGDYVLEYGEESVGDYVLEYGEEDVGDYVIEYGEEDETQDENENLCANDANWWTSFILYQVFDIVEALRNRRRSSISEMRNRFSYGGSSSDEGSSLMSAEIVEYQVDETDDEFMSVIDIFRNSSSYSKSVKNVAWMLPHALVVFILSLSFSSQLAFDIIFVCFFLLFIKVNQLCCS